MAATTTPTSSSFKDMPPTLSSSHLPPSTTSLSSPMPPPTTSLSSTLPPLTTSLSLPLVQLSSNHHHNILATQLADKLCGLSSELVLLSDGEEVEFSPLGREARREVRGWVASLLGVTLQQEKVRQEELDSSLDTSGQEVLDELCEVTKVTIKEKTTISMVTDESVIVDEVVDEFVRIVEEENQDAEEDLEETEDDLKQDASRSIPEALGQDLFGKDDDMEENLKKDVSNVKCLEDILDDGIVAGNDDTKEDYDPEKEWLSYVENILEISVSDNEPIDKEMTEEEWFEEISETDHDEESFEATRYETLLHLENKVQVEDMIEGILEILEHKINENLDVGDLEDDVENFSFSTSSLVDDELEELNIKKITEYEDEQYKVEEEMTEEGWFEAVSETDQDTESLEEPFATLEDEIESEELEPEITDMTEEEWFVEVSETDADNENLGSQLVDDILEAMFEQQNFATRFALVDGEVVEDEEEIENEDEEVIEDDAQDSPQNITLIEKEDSNLIKPRKDTSKHDVLEAELEGDVKNISFSMSDSVEDEIDVEHATAEDAKNEMETGPTIDEMKEKVTASMDSKETVVSAAESIEDDARDSSPNVNQIDEEESKPTQPQEDISSRHDELEAEQQDDIENISLTLSDSEEDEIDAEPASAGNIENELETKSALDEIKPIESKETEVSADEEQTEKNAESSTGKEHGENNTASTKDKGVDKMPGTFETELNESKESGKENNETMKGQIQSIKTELKDPMEESIEEVIKRTKEAALLVDENIIRKEPEELDETDPVPENYEDVMEQPRESVMLLDESDIVEEEAERVDVSVQTDFDSSSDEDEDESAEDEVEEDLIEKDQAVAKTVKDVIDKSRVGDCGKIDIKKENELLGLSRKAEMETAPMENKDKSESEETGEWNTEIENHVNESIETVVMASVDEASKMETTISEETTIKESPVKTEQLLEEVSKVKVISPEEKESNAIKDLTKAVAEKPLKVRKSTTASNIDSEKVKVKSVAAQEILDKLKPEDPTPVVIKAVDVEGKQKIVKKSEITKDLKEPVIVTKPNEAIISDEPEDAIETLKQKLKMEAAASEGETDDSELDEEISNLYTEIDTLKKIETRKPEDQTLRCGLCDKDKDMKATDLVNHLSTSHFVKELFSRFPLKQEESCSLCIGEGRDRAYTMTKVRSNYVTHLGKVHGRSVELLTGGQEGLQLRLVTLLLRVQGGRWRSVLAPLNLSPDSARMVRVATSPTKTLPAPSLASTSAATAPTPAATDATPTATAAPPTSTAATPPSTAATPASIAVATPTPTPSLAQQVLANKNETNQVETRPAEAKLEAKSVEIKPMVKKSKVGRPTKAKLTNTNAVVAKSTATAKPVAAKKEIMKVSTTSPVETKLESSVLKDTKPTTAKVGTDKTKEASKSVDTIMPQGVTVTAFAESKSESADIAPKKKSLLSTVEKLTQIAIEKVKEDPITETKITEVEPTEKVPVKIAGKESVKDGATKKVLNVFKPSFKKSAPPKTDTPALKTTEVTKRPADKAPTANQPMAKKAKSETKPPLAKPTVPNFKHVANEPVTTNATITNPASASKSAPAQSVVEKPIETKLESNPVQSQTKVTKPRVGRPPKAKPTQANGISAKPTSIAQSTEANAVFEKPTAMTKPVVVKAAAPRPGEAKAASPKTAEAKAAAPKPAEAKAAAPKPAEAKASAEKTADIKTFAAKTAVTKASAAKLADSKASAAKPAEAKAAAPKPAEAKAAAPKPAEAKASAEKTAEIKTSATKTAVTKASAAKLAETKASAAKLAESKASAAKSAEAKAASANLTDTKASPANRGEPKAVAAKPTKAKAAVAKPAETKAVAANPAQPEAAATQQTDTKAAATKKTMTKVVAPKVENPVAAKPVQKPLLTPPADAKSIAANAAQPNEAKPVKSKPKVGRPPKATPTEATAISAKPTAIGVGSKRKAEEGGEQKKVRRKA